MGLTRSFVALSRPPTRRKNRPGVAVPLALHSQHPPCRRAAPSLCRALASVALSFSRAHSLRVPSRCPDGRASPVRKDQSGEARSLRHAGIFMPHRLCAVSGLELFPDLICVSRLSRYIYFLYPFSIGFQQALPFLGNHGPAATLPSLSTALKGLAQGCGGQEFAGAHRASVRWRSQSYPAQHGANPKSATPSRSAIA